MKGAGSVVRVRVSASPRIASAAPRTCNSVQRCLPAAVPVALDPVDLHAPITPRFGAVAVVALVEAGPPTDASRADGVDVRVDASVCVAEVYVVLHRAPKEVEARLRGGRSPAGDAPPTVEYVRAAVGCDNIVGRGTVLRATR